MKATLEGMEAWIAAIEALVENGKRDLRLLLQKGQKLYYNGCLTYTIPCFAIFGTFALKSDLLMCISSHNYAKKLPAETKFPWNELVKIIIGFKTFEPQLIG